MLRTRQNHEEEHDEVDTSSYQCTVRTIGAYSVFGVQAMAAPRCAWTHLYIAKQNFANRDGEEDDMMTLSLYVFPQSEVKEDLCTRLLQHYLIYFSIGLRLAKSKVGCPPAQRLSEDTGERKAKLRRGAASIPARH